MFVNYCLRLINCGLMLGLILSVMLLLRPVLKRVLSPQQRLWVWIAGWFYGWRALLDFGLLYQWNVDRFQTFQNLVTPRTAGFLGGTPAFLPGEYEGPGAYHIALPGGNLIQTELTDWMVYALCLLWVAGAVGMLVWFWRQNRRLIQLGRQGTLMDENDPRIADYKNGKYPVSELKVYITPNLPTSFVSRNWFDYSYEVYLQQELSPERMDLVLTHELRHIDLLHCWWKAVATLSLALFWWNPLVWLSFRCFCLDVELACDESVMKRLTPQQRKEYARTLLELGTGRQLWDAPLAFGECDSAIRIKKLVAWKKRKWYRQLPTWCLAAALSLFLMGGSESKLVPQDMVLNVERGGASFVEVLADEMYWNHDLPGEEAKALDITGVWTANPPGELDTYLWVRSGADTWYRVRYAGIWKGAGGEIDVINVQSAQAPDLTGCTQLY